MEHWDTFRRDSEYALRMLRRSPGFTAGVVLTLAIGVGSTTAVFTLADPMLYRPLPYPDADRIVEIYARAGDTTGVLHVPDFLRAAESHRGLEAIALFSVAPMGGRLAGRTEEPLAYQITSGFFDVIQVRPVIGREFVASEYQVNARANVAILTHEFWQKAFGGRRDILSQSIDLEGPYGRRLRIVGVLPPAFVLPDDVNRQPEFLVPYAPDPATQGNRSRIAWPIARLLGGVTYEAAAGEMQGILRAVEEEFPQFARGRQAHVRSLREGLFGSLRTPLVMLLAATGCVLLLACVNLAHLFMSRLQGRQRELGVRLALGAGRGRLAQLLLMEAAIFAVLGALAALFFAQWTFDLIMARTPEFVHVYRLLPAGVDVRVATFGALLAGIALAIFGVIPAIRASDVDIRASLLDGGASTPTRSLRRSATLIAVQCGVAICLIVTGTLIVRSFARLVLQPLGFEPNAVRIVALDLPASGDPVATTQQMQRIYEHLVGRLPVRVALAGGWPAQTLPGAVSTPDGKAVHATAYPASASFYDVFGVRLIAGRLHTDREAFTNAHVVIVDQAAAARLWPGADPIGREVVDWTGTVRRVIGVVGTLRTSLSLTTGPEGSAFIPFPAKSRTPSLALHDPDDTVSAEMLRLAVREVAPGARVAIRSFKPFERTLGQPRFLALLLGTLNLFTIALTLVGIFGIVNYETARRTREVGVRMSLGADASRIRAMIVRRALAPALLGSGVGLGVSLWWTPTLQSLLFGLEPNDPATLLFAFSIVCVLVLMSAALPAWRASRLDPVGALRVE